MMRIQVLPLPSVVVGDDVQEPFALIVDQHNSDMDETTADAWRTFKESAGARALLITPDTVEVVGRYAEAAPQQAEQAPTASRRGDHDPDKALLYESIRDELIVYIDRGIYPVGALLPSIRDISGRWGVSTTTARRVLAELVTAGYARPDGTRGHVVTASASAALSASVPIVLRDRNGNAMNMRVTCSCGNEMTTDWSAYDYAPGERTQERTQIVCKGCGNRLTVAIPLGATQGKPVDALDQPCFRLSGDEDGGVSLHCRDHFDGGWPLAYYGANSPYPATEVPAVTTIGQLQDEAARHLASHHGLGRG
jgi:DNA-binding transcriptional regulator YhcF (GntR family)